MVSDEQVLAVIREQASSLSPGELTELCSRLRQQPFTQSTLVFFFKRAFPNIPLRTLIEAGAWHRVSDGGMTDAEFDALLAPHTRMAER